jgi:hypothetical protein
MHELRIYDKVDNENYIINLGELIKNIEKIESNFLEDELSSGKQYQIEGSHIFPIIKSKEQYFYHVTMKKIDSDIELGVFDSTYLFLRSSNDEFLKQIKGFFNDGQVVELLISYLSQVHG